MVTSCLSGPHGYTTFVGATQNPIIFLKNLNHSNTRFLLTNTHFTVGVETYENE